MIFIYVPILVFSLFIVFWLISLIFAQLFGAPTVHSSRQAVMDTLKLSDLKKDELIVDLGCGSARVLIMAAKEFGAKGVGIDRSPFCYLISKFNVFLAGQQKRVKIYFGSFEKNEKYLNKADVVYLYLLNSVNRKIEDWLFRNVPAEARIVSLSFDFERHRPKKEVETRTLHHTTKARLY